MPGEGGLDLVRLLGDLGVDIDLADAETEAEVDVETEAEVDVDIDGEVDAARSAARVDTVDDTGRRR